MFTTLYLRVVSADFASSARIGRIVVELLLIHPCRDSGRRRGLSTGREDILPVRPSGVRERTSRRVRLVAGPVGSIRLQGIAPRQVRNAGAHSLPRLVVCAQVLVSLALRRHRGRRRHEPKPQRHHKRSRQSPPRGHRSS